MESSDRLLHPAAKAAIREAIHETGGNEVFFIGRPGPEHAVGSVQVLARGHDRAVPAIVSAARPGEVLIHNHPSGVLRPSEADLSIAAQGGAQGIAFLIVDNLAERLYAVVEPRAERPRVEITAAEIAQMLGPTGAVAGALSGWEARAPQVAMASTVARAFNDNRVTLIEAGTGTGKSLAYLLPAILSATRNRERVVISTNTINLQEQLLGKDLPFLRDQIGLDFKCVLLKGRSNYLCLRKTEFAARAQDTLFEAPARATLKLIHEWSKKTRDGSRSELPGVVPEEVWEAVSSDADDCMKVRSPYFGDCFYFQSRRQAASADVLIVNHHLLLADLATRAVTGDYEATAVLPPYDRLIIDEAHNLEDVASSYFGDAVSALGVIRQLGRLQSELQPNRGILHLIHDSVAADEELAELVGDLGEQRHILGDQVRSRFASIARHTMGYLGVEELGRQDLRVRLTSAVRSHPAIAEGVAVEARELTREIGAYVAQLAQALRRIRRHELGRSEEVASALLRVDAVRAHLDAAAGLLHDFPTESPAECRWIEVRKLRSGEAAARLANAPLAVADELRRTLYDKLRTVVLTSATLTVGRSFDHFRARLGIDQVVAERVVCEQYESPFDYGRQALLVALSDMPEPQSPEYAQAVREVTAEAVRHSRGRAFVLFTSYGLLDCCLRGLEAKLQAQGLVVLRQGQAPRDQLLKRFRREPGAVLFAVDSFWEGVDVAGPALSLVILARLPFRVPTEPLQEARVEAIERAGGDPFLEYAVPQAVIKLRQGFGRLIRSRKDRGAVLILDPRVSTRRYGKLFLDSLPPAPRVVAPRALALQALARFYAAEQPEPPAP